MSESDDRVRAILAALDALPPGALEAMARVAPPAAAEVLRRLEGVLTSSLPPSSGGGLGRGDREARMREIVSRDLASLEAVGGLFGAGAGGRGAPPILDVVRGAVARADAELARAEALGASLRRAQAELSAALDPIVQALDDSELRVVAEEAAAELRDPAVVLLCDAIVADAAAVRESLGDAQGLISGGDAGAWAAKMAPRVAALEAHAREAAALGPTLPGRVAGPIGRLASLARARSHPLAAQLAEVDARLTETISGAQSRETRLKWRVALDLALAARDVRSAWVAGKRVQVEALDTGEPKLAAMVAHRVADLARDVGVSDVELTARMEEALLLVRIPGFEASGRSMTEDVLARAERAEPPVRGRVGVMAGQAFEALGDDARARTLYRRVQRLKVELGRASLRLGRLELKGGQPSQGRKNVRLAYDLAITNGDPLLYAEAVPTLISALVEAGDEAGARVVAREARDRYAKMGHLEAFRADLVGRWGEARVAGWWA